MTDFHRPASSLGRLTAIDIYTDPEVAVGTAILDHDPAEPRHIKGIRAATADFTLTDEQTEQVRDHYQAMDERAGRLLAEWQQLAARAGLDTR